MLLYWSILVTVTRSDGPIERPSLSHVMDSGRSPLVTEHVRVVRSPRCKSRSAVNGLILGGTGIITTRQLVSARYDT